MAYCDSNCTSSSRSPDSGLYVLRSMHRSDLVGLQLHAARRPSTRGEGGLHRCIGIDAAVCNVRTDVTTDCTAASPRASSPLCSGSAAAAAFIAIIVPQRVEAAIAPVARFDHLRNIFRLDAKRISFDRTSKILAAIKLNK
uniref:Uncharacterized protein n=1 Tax=Trichogramma kaykai TaxID=54128 RepID=A0ABD2VXU7_9HYME